MAITTKAETAETTTIVAVIVAATAAAVAVEVVVIAAVAVVIVVKVDNAVVIYLLSSWLFPLTMAKVHKQRTMRNRTSSISSRNRLCCSNCIVVATLTLCPVTS